MDYIKVGMAEFKVATNPGILATMSLGSCLGIVLYDNKNKIGGIAHPMLPRISEAKDSSNPAKFVDSAIEEMLNEMEKLGADKRYIKAKIFGGANMFPDLIKSSDTLLNVGGRNAEVVRDELEAKKIKIVAEDVGGYIGRSVILNIKDGLVKVRTVKGEETVY